MLDLFTIFSKSGIVLWYFQGTTQLFTNSVNELIKSVILQERGVQSAWNHNTLSLQYKLDNEFELVFVVAYQNILKLAYIDKFLNEIQLRFRDRFKQVIENCQYGHNFDSFKSDFDEILADCEREAEEQAQMARKPRKYEESEKSSRTVASMIETKTTLIGSLVQSATNSTPSEKTKGKNEENVENLSANLIDDLESKKSNGPSPRPAMRKFEPKSKKTPTSPQPKGKAPKKWDDNVDVNTLDYSSPSNDSKEDLTTSQYASKKDIGRSIGELKPIEVNYEEEIEEVDDYVPETNKNKSKLTSNKQNGKNSTGLFSSLKSLVGGKMLTKETIQPVMEKMQEHLVSKNVAAEIATKVCDNVAQNLEGKQLGNFQFATTIIKQALHESMVQILTPKRRVDILRDVFETQRQKRPYVIVFCGVNGVGKSTNLAKVTFWLIENNFRVLIAACDTFRSGAVEQLKTHMRHLNALHPPENHGGNQMVELFEQGYGKDPAAIAHDAISYAKDARKDVVLVDTAGRMQDNEPLMKALAKLINVNNPDLVLFVGEALVGNEAVDQVRKFNQALIDNSPVKTTNPDLVRTIDGIVLTKFDTIDDKVGAAISMTYTTGQPIVFVGTGQTYADLKSLNAESVVKSLLK
ncbi:unnamed protein product [Brachionus calyciflorus]|uniref:SRP54-type proteins GTP-binding domain-containing protein n=1 Tax=Brachionus calyciflorus TaxID=104777 RepID=A0A813NBF6_9BILA|nr:unnamed protein product [Brachionus calyciflorus]